VKSVSEKFYTERPTSNTKRRNGYQFTAIFDTDYTDYADLNSVISSSMRSVKSVSDKFSTERPTSNRETAVLPIIIRIIGSHPG
jgi:hypothetical protein